MGWRRRIWRPALRSLGSRSKRIVAVVMLSFQLSFVVVYLLYTKIMSKNKENNTAESRLGLFLVILHALP